jgi:hypothetical protein
MAPILILILILGFPFPPTTITRRAMAMVGHIDIIILPLGMLPLGAWALAFRQVGFGRVSRVAGG